MDPTDGLSQGPNAAPRPRTLAPDARASPFLPRAHFPDDIIPGLCALRGGGGRCVQRGTGEVIVLCLPPSLPLLGNTLVTVLTSAPV